MEKAVMMFYRIKKLLTEIKREHVGAYAAQSAFFFIMCFLPLVFLILTFVNLSSIDVEKVFDLLKNIMPGKELEYIKHLFTGFSFNTSAVISLTTILTAWSAGKGFYALSGGFHSILHIEEKRNYILRRLIGLLYSLAFAIIIDLFFLVGIFGNSINSYIVEIYPPYSQFTYLISGVRKLFLIGIFFVILLLMYRFVPDWNSYYDFKSRKNKIKIKFFMISSLLASASMYAYTVIFSVYVENYSNLSHIYGSLATLIGIMLWLYGSMYILICGFKLVLVLDKIKERRKIKKLYPII